MDAVSDFWEKEAEKDRAWKEARSPKKRKYRHGKVKRKTRRDYAKEHSMYDGFLRKMADPNA